LIESIRPEGTKAKQARGSERLTWIQPAKNQITFADTHTHTHTLYIDTHKSNSHETFVLVTPRPLK